MTTEYQSTEQKIGEAVKPYAQSTGKFLKGFVPVAGGAFANLFRVPSFIRKLINDQCYLQRKLGTFGAEYRGENWGAVTGLVSSGAFLVESIREANKGNYIPLIVLGTLNAASGLFELGRYCSKRSLENRMEAK